MLGRGTCVRFENSAPFAAESMVTLYSPHSWRLKSAMFESRAETRPDIKN
jgi:hypothetical protein